MDFRKDLYAQYVSTHTSAPTEQQLQKYWGWCRKKYLPLLGTLRKDSAILELGCGSGSMQVFLKQNGFINVQGIDISEEQVRLALTQGHNVQLVDVFEFFDSCEETFDAMIAFDFIEHFTREELTQLIGAINDHLNPGGLLMFQTPNGAGLFSASVIYGDFTHMTIFSPRSLAQWLSSYGFEDFEFRDTSPIGTGLKGFLQLWTWKLLTGFANMIGRIEGSAPQTVWTKNVICLCRKPSE